MTDAADQAAILQKILDELKGMAAASGEGGGGSSPLGGGGTQRSGEGEKEFIARQQAAAQADVDALEARKALVGELDAQTERQLKQQREFVAAVFDTTAEMNEWARATKELNTQFDLGETKGKSMVAALLPVNGILGSMMSMIPRTAEGFKGLGSGIKEMFTSGAMAAGIVEKLLSIAVATADANAAMVKATGTATDYTAGIAQTRNELREYGVTAVKSGEANAALYQGMSSFTTLNKSTADSLRGQAALLQELNVPLESTAKMWDQATKSLGFNETQLGELNQTLQDTAQSLDKSTTVVFQEFSSVAKQLAFYGEDVVGVFQDLQKQSKATGLEVSQLVSISGKAFDTFDGAAQKVGRLNAILGGPYLNSIDMLNASESERLEMLTESMDASGQLFSDMGKYEQLSIADALGVDVDTARRMFGNLSAAEELEIKRQEEIKETAMRSQKQIDKLKNAFNSMFVALEPVIKAITWFVDLLVKIMTNPFGKWLIIIVGGLLLLTVIAYKAAAGIVAVQATLGALGGTAGAAGAAASNAGRGVGNFLSHTARGARNLGNALKGTYKEILAFGAAIMMIGAGIAVAAYGLSYLVLAFKDLSGGQIAGALAALVIVGALFAVMLVVLAGASLGAAGPLIALGFAFLLIGGGIFLAAYGMSLLVSAFGDLEGGQIFAAALSLIFFSTAIAAIVIAAVMSTAAAPMLWAMAAVIGAIGVAAILMGFGINLAALGLAQLIPLFKDLDGPNLIAAAIGMGIFSAAVYFLVGASVAAAAAGWALVATAVLIAALGAAAVLLGFGINLAAKGLAILVEQLFKIPADQIFATAKAFGALGMSLVTLAYGAAVGAAGLGALAVALLLAAYPLMIGSTVLGAFGGALMIVGTGMNLVAAGTESLKASIFSFVAVLPQVIAFSAALMGIGAAALGILATAAALAYLTPALLAFAGATKVIGLSKLEALTEFNKSATLTIDTVYKPDTNAPGREATEKRMDAAAAGKTEDTPFPWPSDERLSKAAQAKDSTVSKPVVNFNKHSVLVKIGERELHDVVMEVLKGPEFKKEIGLR